MQEGTIKNLMEKGFGFITVEGRPKDLFFHSSSLSGGVVFTDLKEGDKVRFDIGESPKGPCAENVEVVG